MFTLRKISFKGGVEMNIGLGNSYTLIIEEKNQKEFQEYKKEHYTDREMKMDAETYGILSNDNGQPIELFKRQKNFIMCSDGKTFDNISYR